MIGLIKIRSFQHLVRSHVTKMCRYCVMNPPKVTVRINFVFSIQQCFRETIIFAGKYFRKTVYGRYNYGSTDKERIFNFLKICFN